MPGTTAQVLFPFEDVGASFDVPPLAARRALDVAGFRLSNESFRSLPPDERVALARLGHSDVVDTAWVERIVRGASPPASRLKPVPDPDPSSVPEQLQNALGARLRVGNFDWMRLRPVERYALVQILRRAIAHDDLGLLELAVASVLPFDEHDRPVARSADGQRPPSVAPSVRASVRASARESSPPRSAASSWVSDERAFHSADSLASMPRARSSELPPALSERPRISDPPLAVPASAPPPSFGPSPPSFGPPPRSVQPPLSTHLGPSGEVRMVDVGAKPASTRRATASGIVHMRPETAQRLARGDAPKGEVLATARVAGILAAKRTPELIPLCHHVALSKVEVHVDVEPSSGVVTVTSVAEAVDRTGVEMEALVATSIACLTIYDMLKGVDRDMTIGEIALLSKTGGKSGPYERGT